MTGTTLGIDLGSSGVRAVVLARAHAGRVVATSAVRLERAARHDAALLWGAVTSVLHGLDLAGVDALAVAGTSGTLLAIGADGAPASRLSLYSDSSPLPAQAGVDRCAPAGGVASALARAIELQASPGAVRVIHEADWVAGQFCGRFDTTDENNALKTGYDPVVQVWPDWLPAAGMRRAMLPSVVAPGTRLGPADTAAALACGVPPTAAVAAGTTDGCASFLATAANDIGDGVSALGTTTTLKLVGPVPVFAPEYGIYSHRVGGLWLPGGASNVGGAVLARYFTPEQIVALSAGIDPARPSPCDFYPLPAPGERFPINDPALQPRLEPRPADDADFLHGLLESIARIEALGYRRLAELGAPPLARVFTTGGGAANPVWMQIRARVLGVPVTRADADAAHGAAILALSALV